VVGLTRRMVSSGGDPMVFVPLKDAQEAQFLKDNDAIVNERARTADNPALNRPACPDCSTRSRHRRPATAPSMPCWCAWPRATPRIAWRRRSVGGSTCRPSRAPDGGHPGRQADRHRVRQIGMFLVILTIVSAAIVAFIIYTMTLGKIREIAVLKLIGTHNRTIAGMILQQALGWA
jgi:putative ABC transport system permease protein